MYVAAFQAHLDAVSRAVTAREVDGLPAHGVQASRRLDAVPAAVWFSLTDAALLAGWLGTVTGELDLGGRFQLEGNASGTVLRCDARRHLVLTWEFGRDASVLDVRLTPDRGGTRLVLEHLARPSAHWKTYGPGATGVGWDLGLFGLERLLSGAPLDRARFDAWAVTAPAKALIRRSAQGWASAARAAGMDPALAAAQGRRTAAFYTGEPAPGD